MSDFLKNGPQCEDVINTLVLKLESNLSSRFKLPPLELPRELQAKGCSNKLRICVAHHDQPVIKVEGG